MLVLSGAAGHRVQVTIKDYIFGRRANLASSLDPELVQQAIRQNVRSNFNPFASGVAGWCRSRRIGLRWATAMFNNGLQPVFRGKLMARNGGTRLEATFGAPPLLLVFFAIWCFLLALMIVHTLSAYVNDMLGGTNAFNNIGASILFMAIPFGMHLLLNRNADRQFESILAFLNEFGGFDVEPSELVEERENALELPVGIPVEEQMHAERNGHEQD